VGGDRQGNNEMSIMRLSNWWDEKAKNRAWGQGKGGKFLVVMIGGEAPK